MIMLINESLESLDTLDTLDTLDLCVQETQETHVIPPSCVESLASGSLPDWCADAVHQADELALASRKAALAGDHQRAHELRAEFDRLWDAIEAQAEAEAAAVFLGR